MWHVDASNTTSDSMFEMSTSCLFARLEPFAERQYCCINWTLRHDSPDRLQNVFHSKVLVGFGVLLVYLEHHML